MAPLIAIAKPEPPELATGNYKEFGLGPKGYRKEVEEEGSGDQPKAQVCPCRTESLLS